MNKDIPAAEQFSGVGVALHEDLPMPTPTDMHELMRDSLGPPASARAVSTGVTKQELEDAFGQMAAAWQATPAKEPFTQRLLSRKLIATAVYQVGVLGTTIAGGLPPHWAAIISGVGIGAYLLAQGVTDAAQMLNVPPPGTVNVPAPTSAVTRR